MHSGNDYNSHNESPRTQRKFEELRRTDKKAYYSARSNQMKGDSNFRHTQKSLAYDHEFDPRNVQLRAVNDEENAKAYKNQYKREEAKNRLKEQKKQTEKEKAEHNTLYNRGRRALDNYVGIPLHKLIYKR